MQIQLKRYVNIRVESDLLATSIVTCTQLAVQQITLDDLRYHMTRKDVEDLSIKYGLSVFLCFWRLSFG